jgi:hypothetical protein
MQLSLFFEISASGLAACAIDCSLTEWAEWSLCSVSCGPGRNSFWWHDALIWGVPRTILICRSTSLTLSDHCTNLFTLRVEFILFCLQRLRESATFCKRFARDARGISERTRSVAVAAAHGGKECSPEDPADPAVSSCCVYLEFLSVAMIPWHHVSHGSHGSCAFQFLMSWKFTSSVHRRRCSMRRSHLYAMVCVVSSLKQVYNSNQFEIFWHESIIARYPEHHSPNYTSWLRQSQSMKCQAATFQAWSSQHEFLRTWSN